MDDTRLKEPRCGRKRAGSIVMGCSCIVY